MVFERNEQLAGAENLLMNPRRTFLAVFSLLASLATADALSLDPRFMVLSATDPRNDADLWWSSADAATWTVGAATNWVSRGRLPLVAVRQGTNIVTRIENAQNGVAAIDISGKNGYFDFTPVNWTNGVLTAIAVYRRPVAGKFSNALGAGGQSAPLFWGADNMIVAQYVDGNRISSSAVTATGIFCHVMQSTGTSASNLSVRLDGVEISLGARTAFAAGTTINTIGRYAHHHDAMQLFEVLAWNRVLTLDELLWLEWKLDQELNWSGS